MVHILKTKAESVSESSYTANLDLVLIVLRILNRLIHQIISFVKLEFCLKWMTPLEGLNPFEPEK